MKKHYSIIIATALLLCIALCGCGQQQAAVDPVESAEPNVFLSDTTAIDFVEGYWTDGIGDYISASRGDSMLIVWSTNLPTVECDLYVLRDGVLVGGSADEDGAMVETQVLRFEKLDEDSIQIDDIITGTSNTFIRDSMTVDTDNLDNDYVFWSMDRAALYLTGMWLDAGGDYFVLSVDSEGMVNVNSNLDFPQCDKVDFCNGKLSAVTYNEDGSKEFTELYDFDIQDEDNVIITNLDLDASANFERISTELDAQLLNSRYIFANATRAFSFLEGLWKDGNGNYFSVTTTNGNMKWNTNLVLPNHTSYTFADGGLVGLDLDDDGNTVTTMIYEFTVVSDDEVQIKPTDSESVYDLIRN